MHPNRAAGEVKQNHQTTGFRACFPPLLLRLTGFLKHGGLISFSPLCVETSRHLLLSLSAELLLLDTWS